MLGELIFLLPAKLVEEASSRRPVGQRWLPVPARRRQWSSPAGWNTAELTLWPSGKGGPASTLMTNGVGRGGGSGCRIRCLRRVRKSP